MPCRCPPAAWSATPAAPSGGRGSTGSMAPPSPPACPPGSAPRCITWPGPWKCWPRDRAASWNKLSTSNGWRWMVRSLETLILTLALAVAGCGGASAPGEPGGTPSRSVTQGGPQDIGQFRKIVADGKVPSSTLLDEAASFNEHALD